MGDIEHHSEGVSPVDGVQEERYLKLGYAGMLAERWPISKDVRNCDTREGAYFFDLERRFMRLPQGLDFDSLKNDISEQHRDRIHAIWIRVVETHHNWLMAVASLRLKWTTSVPESDSAALDTISSVQRRVREEFKPGFAAMISFPEHNDGEDGLSALEMWRMEEEGLRRNYQNADKIFLLTLRLYCEMLLEKPEKMQSDTVLPLPAEHPRRLEIVKLNRYLRLIDISHQAMTIAKAGHHQQKEGRLRETEKIPYVFHPLAVLFQHNVDVLLYIIEAERLGYSFILGIIVAAMHDLGEDTDLTIKTLRRFLESRADMYDSTIEPLIKSGFGLDREQIKVRVLNLIGDKTRSWLLQILRILAKNTTLNASEQRRALEQNVAGEKTQQILGIDDKVVRGLNPAIEMVASRTFVQFPETDEEKSDAFLVRYSALASDKTRQVALIIKLEDRAHNVSTLRGKKPDSQRRTLRGTTSRLIAWAMLDHDQDTYPLYNALPRLIDVTLAEYDRFSREFPDQFEEIDRTYIGHLKVWQISAKRLPIPTNVQSLFAEFDAQKAAA